MGKASRWFRSVLGLKKPQDDNKADIVKPHAKRRWSFVRSRRDKYLAAPEEEEHAVAVAAATAAVAEAAVATAQAAAVVVRLTGSRTDQVGPCAEELAATKIQSAFRGYLARRALRALRGLVKLQAMVRGCIERKRQARRLQQRQALSRAQARVRAGRAANSAESSQFDSKLSYVQSLVPQTPEKHECGIRSRSANPRPSQVHKRTGLKYERPWEHGGRIWSMDDERDDKILEIDTGKHQFRPKLMNLSHSSHLVLEQDQYSRKFAVPFAHCSAEIKPMDLFYDAENNSPEFYSASSSRGGSSRRGPSTPTKSDGTRSCRSGCADHPNYMAFTESSRAKVRSYSVPKQRPQYERSCLANKHSVYALGEPRLSTPKVSSLHANFASRAYPGSGHLDRLGMPVEFRY